MNYLLESPQKIMAHHGKSFYFASLIFSDQSFFKVSSLYAFCRYVDDCADELKPDEATIALKNIQYHLDNPQHISELQNSISKLESFGVQRKYMNELLQGALFDVEGKKVQTEEDLNRYCYLVAGVVGLMMCPLIGVKDDKALEHAIALGMGMQITNICRDVLEDTQNGRNYIPSSQLTLEENLKNLLDQADKYYFKAYAGLGYIPFRSRLCILVAGEVYRAIGTKIRKNSYNVLAGRTYLNIFEKIFVVVKTLPQLLTTSFWKVQI